jgi:ribosomal protein S19
MLEKKLINSIVEKKRSDIITPQDAIGNQTIKVHTGNGFKELKITSNHVGKKFGEFVPTKVTAKYKKHGKKHK